MWTWTERGAAGYEYMNSIVDAHGPATLKHDCPDSWGDGLGQIVGQLTRK